MAKKTTKKTPARSSTKKTTKKPASKKAPAKKPPAKASTKKTTKKPAAKKTTKKVAAKPASKKTTKKVVSSTKKIAGKPAAKTSKVAPAKPDDKKVTRKGITIVSKKTMRRKVSPKPLTTIPTLGGSLLGQKGKPLIASGPKAPKTPGAFEELDDDARKKLKTPFNKRELDKFKAILLKKFEELTGDVTRLEDEALNSQSGALSNLPQHPAEQGSDAYDQTLSLDLAAADRETIKEIIDALKRIANKTFGLCEMTGKPINTERLEELPWARHSIDAAREMERRTQYQ